MGLHDRVLHPLREATELARSDVDPDALHVKYERSFQYDEDFVALAMGVDSAVVPTGLGVVEPQLKVIGLPRDSSSGDTTSKECRLVRQRDVVESTDLGHSLRLPDPQP